MIASRLASSLLVGALLVATSGCGRTETHAALLRPAEPRTTRPVELYMADAPPPTRGFRDLAFVQAIGFGSRANPEDVARALTDRAASLGCDAVIRTVMDLGYSRANAVGVCVKWTEPAGAVPERGTLPPAPPPNPSPPPVPPAPAPKMEQLPSAAPGAGN